jgi:excisionase family DNA binding protein
MTASARQSSESIVRLAVTVKEGARMLGVGRATLYKLVISGEIASFTIGRARRIAISTIEQYAQHHSASLPTDWK